MKWPNLTIYQYQILEDLYKQNKGFKKNKKFKKAIDKLRENNLIKKRPLILTEDGYRLTKDFYRFRHFTPQYEGNILDLDLSNYKFNGFDFNNFVASFDHKFVEEILGKYKKNKNYFVLDPFGGTGTTSVVCQKKSLNCLTFDINPLMVFKTKVKAFKNISAWKIIENYEECVTKFISLNFEEKKFILANSNLKLMGNNKLNKWLSPNNQRDLVTLFYVISKIKSTKIRQVFEMICLETAVSISNARFCPGITFYANENKKKLLKEFKKNLEIYLANLREIKKNNAKTIVKKASALDSKKFSEYKNKVDLIISSPPYPNNIDYVLFSKLELFLSGFVKSKDGLKSLRKKMLSSNPKRSFSNKKIDEEVSNIAQVKNISDLISAQLKNKNWGFNYDLMIEVYFSQMKEVLTNIYKTLRKDGKCVFLLGDQNILGIKVETAKIVGKIGKKIGFRKMRTESYKGREKILILEK